MTAFIIGLSVSASVLIGVSYKITNLPDDFYDFPCVKVGLVTFSLVMTALLVAFILATKEII